jgi:hypothetical protein
MPPAGVPARALAALAVLALLGALGAGLAQGERAQRGNLIVSLDGDISPLKLPRDLPAPVALRLVGGLKTADGSVLPRVTKVELGLPDQGTLFTRGLPVCSQRRLRDATSVKALAACRGALVGRGRLEADVLLPHQRPFQIDARLLAFNGRAPSGRRAVIVYAFAPNPPTVVVLPFVLHNRKGRFGTALVANLPPTLGPWPHFAHFDLTLSRRYSYRGRTHSYLSASCPIPQRNTAGFFSLARAAFTLVDGRQISTGIARSCRAR